jgi:ABC-2 type transport system ATP-binding protein
MIRLENVSRWYGQVIGVNDVTCSIGAGITALLGPNGAGKSTMLKLITGQMRPTTGRLSVMGESPFANVRVYQRMGYCPEIEQSYDDLTGREFVTLMARMYGISADLKRRVDDVIELVGMSHACDRRIGGYSKGMRQRVKVAQGVIHNPDILILDEPFNGLDPVGRREMTAVLKQLAEAGKCVVVSSHILHEVEQMTQNILLMFRGRLRASGDVKVIRDHIDKHPHHIRIHTESARRLAQLLIERPYIVSARIDPATPDVLMVEAAAPDLFYPEFAETVLATGITVTAFDSPDNNLEAVFRYLVEN